MPWMKRIIELSKGISLGLMITWCTILLLSFALSCSHSLKQTVVRVVYALVMMEDILVVFFFNFL